jgi:hypothetical protein
MHVLQTASHGLSSHTKKEDNFLDLCELNTRPTEVSPAGSAEVRTALGTDHHLLRSRRYLYEDETVVCVPLSGVLFFLSF